MRQRSTPPLGPLVSLTCATLLVAAAVACKSGDNNDTPKKKPGSSASSSSGGDPSPTGTTPGGTPEAGAPPPAMNVTRQTMEHDGQTRIYFLALPRTYDATKTYPVVMSFHGNPATAEGQMQWLPFEVASGQDAVLVYPQALGVEAGAFSWDLYTPTESNADMGWIKALIDEVATKANIDKGKVFGAGYSGGGFFISQYACRFGGVFRAISVNAGGGPDEPQMGYPKRDNGCYVCPGGPIPTLVTHGEADGVVEVASGIFTADCYAATNGCNGSRSATTPAPCEQYDGCGKPVKRCIVPGQSHFLWDSAWAESWAFFKAAP